MKNETNYPIRTCANCHKKCQGPPPMHYEAGKVSTLIDMSVRYVKDEVKRGNLAGYRLGSRIIICGHSLRDFLYNRIISKGSIPKSDG